DNFAVVFIKQWIFIKNHINSVFPGFKISFNVVTDMVTDYQPVHLFRFGDRNKISSDKDPFYGSKIEEFLRQGRATCTFSVGKIEANPIILQHKGQDELERSGIGIGFHIYLYWSFLSL